jgi:methyl-accepting chemotaxis protein/methyl-accepting chemotaxis protein-1 (serine sensor receptor)
MGFAVVADEVRNLARRSAQAAKETAALIEDSIAKSKQGNARVAEVAGAMRAVTEEAAQVKALVEQVDLGGQEEKIGMEQVTRGMGEIEQMTQTSAADGGENAAVARNSRRNARHSRESWMTWPTWWARLAQAATPAQADRLIAIALR